MYRCEITGKQSKPNAKLHKVIALTRNKTYHRWVKDEDTREWTQIIAGVGFEPVKELSCSEEGAALWASWSAEEKDAFLKGMSSR